MKQTGKQSLSGFFGTPTAKSKDIAGPQAPANHCRKASPLRIWLIPPSKKSLPERKLRSEEKNQGKDSDDGTGPKSYFFFLYDVIDSLTSNLATSWDNKNVLRTSGELSAEAMAELNQTSYDKPLDNAKAEDFLLKLIDEIGDDPKLTRLYDLFEQGYTKPAEIAQEMKLEVTEVYQLKRKLRRIGTKVATTIGAGLT